MPPACIICAMAFPPPHVTEADKPLRRKVALAYRSAREAGKSDQRAFDAAMVAYLDERPEAKADARATSKRVAEMVASAVSVDSAWFWKNVPTSPISDE
jgi:hypothetical protein